MLASSICLALIVLALLWDRRVERREHAALVADLCQRIQAPEVAVVDHQLATPRPIVKSPEFDSDDEFHASREQMAAALERS
jgi:hypothetical protein